MFIESVRKRLPNSGCNLLKKLRHSVQRNRRDDIGKAFQELLWDKLFNVTGNLRVSKVKFVLQNIFHRLVDEYLSYVVIICKRLIIRSHLKRVVEPCWRREPD